MQTSVASPPISWLVPFPNKKFVLGRKPSGGKKNADYLTNEVGVQVIVNICPENVLYRLSYAESLGIDVADCPFDAQAFIATGKNKVIDTAVHYVNHAKVIVSRLKQMKALEKVIYLHGMSGDMEEALIGFPVYYLLYPEDARAMSPDKPCEWIQANNYSHLLRDNVDKMELLRAIWEQVKRVSRATHFFGAKK